MRLIANDIFLPTRGRVGNQITLGFLPDVVRENITIVCHPGEEEELSRLWGDKVLRVVPKAANNIGEIRQYCIDKLARFPYVTFVDDSLDFHVRVPGVRGKGRYTKFPLKVITDIHFLPETRERHMFRMFNWILDHLKEDKWGMVGISRRSDNSHHLQDDYTLNSRVCSMWGINLNLYHSLKGAPRFSDMPIKEDFYIYLHFLTNGIPTITSYKYGYGRAGGGSNSEGGCSLYRDTTMAVEAAQKLKEYFPDYVTFKNKGTKSWKGDFGEKTLEVVISSVKAYAAGKKYRIENNLPLL